MRHKLTTGISVFILLISLFTTLEAQNFDEVLKATASDRAADDQFGFSVAISGNYAIISANLEDEDTSGTSTLSSAGSAYIFERDNMGNWKEVQKIVASDREAGDHFGCSVAMSGNYAIVGARYQNLDASGGNSLLSAGAAYIFERDISGNWIETEKLVASDRDVGDDFGVSVGISGNYAIIGARAEDHDALGSNSTNAAGSAYIFERDPSGNWTQSQKIVASDRAFLDQFGYAVAISDSFAIVGSRLEDEDASGANTISAAGSAYIFKLNSGGTWIENQKIVASNRQNNDRFGYSVSISGDYAVVGALYHDFNTLDMDSIKDAGAAFIFERDNSGNWIEAEKIISSNRIETGQFGTAVSISEERVIVGAPIEGSFQEGSAYVFKRTPIGDWELTQHIESSDISTVDWFGSSVSIDTETFLVGAILEDHDTLGANQMSKSGSAYIFSCTTFSSIDATECNSYTAPSGTIFTTSGSHFDTIPNAVGCDSIITINLTINQNSNHTFSETACYTYTSPSGKVFTSSGTHMDTIPNAVGCDSIITIDLTIHQNSSHSFSETTCESYTSPSGLVLTSTGTYTDTIPNSGGCDSIITIDLTINNSSHTISETVCENYIAPSGKVLNASGVYTDTIPNSLGCDSIITINLTISSSNDSISETACESYTSPAGNVFTTSGIYTDTLSNSNGCDSIITVDLTIETLSSNTTFDDTSITTTAIGTYQWMDCRDNSIIPNETTNSYIATTEGSYAVIVTNSCGSDTSDCQTITFTGINESSLRLAINYYPNPVQEELAVVLGNVSQGTITLSNLMGEIIHTFPIEDNLVKLNVATFNPGIYFLIVNSGQQQKTIKWIKK